ncbi:Uncharacterised protein [Mycobacteroides abscessus subsp. abscessus]|nr:Uncharacterised protein [Mycobacteroides abscessus subsp. abscessus]
MAAACTAGAVGGKIHAAAISAARIASDVIIISWAYSISEPTPSADSAMRSKFSASFSSD